MLSREQILGTDLERRPVEVPEWGGTIHVREMTAAERERWEEAQAKSPHHVRALTAAMTVCDESGTLLFTEADAPALGRKSARALARIFPVALGLSAVRAEDVDALEKKSAPAPSDASNTGSPPASA